MIFYTSCEDELSHSTINSLITGIWLNAGSKVPSLDSDIKRKLKQLWLEVGSVSDASSIMSLDASPIRALFTDTRTSKRYEQLADIIFRPHLARSASPPGPDAGHRSPLSSLPTRLPLLSKGDGMALRCLVRSPYEYCITMNLSTGPPTRTTYYE